MDAAGPECVLGSHAVVRGAWLPDGGVMRVVVNINDPDKRYPDIRCIPFEPGLKRIEIENLHLIMTNEQFEVFCKGIARAWKEWTGEE